MTPKHPFCRALEPELVAVAAGEAVASAVQRVEEHTRACAPCRHELGRYRAIEAVARGLREDVPPAEDVAAWFDGTHPIIVVEADGEIVAFAATSSYRNKREAYAGIAEFSVYVTRQARGQGAGAEAMRALIDAAKDAGIWKLLSRIFVENTASRRLMASMGFREVGIYEKHAKLDGQWRDVVIVERLIPENQRD